MCAACLDCLCKVSNSLLYKMSRSALHRLGYVKESQVRVPKKTKRVKDGNKVFVKILCFPSCKCI